MAKALNTPRNKLIVNYLVQCALVLFFSWLIARGLRISKLSSADSTRELANLFRMDVRGAARLAALCTLLLQGGVAWGVFHFARWRWSRVLPFLTSYGFGWIFLRFLFRSLRNHQLQYESLSPAADTSLFTFLKSHVLLTMAYSMPIALGLSLICMLLVSSLFSRPNSSAAAS